MDQPKSNKPSIWALPSKKCMATDNCAANKDRSKFSRSWAFLEFSDGWTLSLRRTPRNFQKQASFQFGPFLCFCESLKALKPTCAIGEAQNWPMQIPLKRHLAIDTFSRLWTETKTEATAAEGRASSTFSKATLPTSPPISLKACLAHSNGSWNGNVLWKRPEVFEVFRAGNAQHLPNLKGTTTPKEERASASAFDTTHTTLRVLLHLLRRYFTPKTVPKHLLKGGVFNHFGPLGPKKGSSCKGGTSSNFELMVS